MEKRVCVIQTDFHQYRTSIDDIRGNDSAHEQQSAQASEQRCVQLEQVRAGLEEQLEEEMACSGQLAMQRDRLQAECNSLRLDMDELEAALTSAEQEKQGSNREVRRLLEVLSLKEDAVEKLQREKEHLAELSQVRP
ncbi:putative uncharacterized protein MYH16 isoform X2 [Gadus macrocephalus]|uniref:putative uncharacterized protein MYH16 isoform X2 n=1 Tax=Gadus macrocephalus TaxID=80720 RepID=UPI0028CB3668|nr:putative uncharacterized protein MYH16 isoform X2 [Gadus macrocephalus]